MKGPAHQGSQWERKAARISGFFSRRLAESRCYILAAGDTENQSAFVQTYFALLSVPPLGFGKEVCIKEVTRVIRSGIYWTCSVLDCPCKQHGLPLAVYMCPPKDDPVTHAPELWLPSALHSRIPVPRKCDLALCFQFLFHLISRTHHIYGDSFPKPTPGLLALKRKESCLEVKNQIFRQGHIWPWPATLLGVNCSSLCLSTSICKMPVI